MAISAIIEAHSARTGAPILTREVPMNIRLITVSLIAVFALWGQKGGGGAPPGGGGATTGSPSPGMGTSSPGNMSRTSPSMTSPGTTPGIQSPIFLSGKVVMADGAPLPPGIAIQRVCQGLPRTVAYTDSRGNFSFQWGDYAGITPDASEPGSTGLS